MDGLALLGILLLIYAAAVMWITLKKPSGIWDMAKIRFFRKTLGESGTVIFFYLFAVVAAAVGIYLMVR